MNKKQLDDLSEIKRASHKIVTLCKKIDESDKLGMKHRHEEYVESLKKERDKVNILVDAL
jgi:hypothetical protein